MATFVDGIAASQNIDTSGERISIAGMDISSLATEGTLTYEHEAATGPKGEKIVIKMPQQTVGKILEAKKIFGPEDCSSDRHTYFWNKCQTPFIYIMGELLDEYTDAARDLAGKFRYDADHREQNQRSMMNFSIEGGYIKVEGMEVTRSVARKCTITVTPANKAAGAEMVPAKGASQSKTDFDSLFKTETIEIELFKTEPKNFASLMPSNDMQKHADILGIEPMKKNVVPFKKALASTPGVATKPAPKASGPSSPKLPGLTNNSGTNIGSTKSGKSIKSHAKIHEYSGFSSQDHNDAANLHHKAAQEAKDPKTGAHHLEKMKLHLQASKTSELKEGRFDRAKAAISAKSVSRHKNPSLFEKSMDAGSGMAAPGQLTGGAALAKEDLTNKPVFTTVAGSKMRSGSPGIKSGMGTSHMGSHVRRGTDHNNGRAKEIAAKQLKNMKSAPKPNLEKTEWTERAEEEYQNWDKREQFQDFMADRMPNLTKGEIDAIGQTLALKKSLDKEKALVKLVNAKESSWKCSTNKHTEEDLCKKERCWAGYEPTPGKKAFSKGSCRKTTHLKKSIDVEQKLSNLIPMAKALKFGSEEDQKATAAALEARAKNPPKKAEPKAKAPELDKETHSEVTHTSSYGDDHETLHLKSGHELHGVKKGRFKAGDKVVAKPHIMGTFLVDHKKD